MLQWLLTRWIDLMENVTNPRVYQRLILLFFLTILAVAGAGWMTLQAQKAELKQEVSRQIAVAQSNIINEVRAETAGQAVKLPENYVTRAEMQMMMDFLKEMRADLNQRITRIENRIN